MQFKVDENLPIEVAQLLNASGHDALTVLDQKLGGSADRVIGDAIRDEKRALITLDLNFADIRAFPPRRIFRFDCAEAHRAGQAACSFGHQAFDPVTEN